MRRRQASEEDHDRSQVFVRQVAEMFVGHDRKQSASISRDAFADGAGDGVIAPLANSGFRVGSNIGRDDSKISFFKQDLAGAFLGSQHGWVRFAVVLRVASHAMHDGVHQVIPALQARWRGFERTCGECALLRANYRPLAYGEGYSKSGEHQHHKKSVASNSCQQPSPTSGHVSSPWIVILRTVCLSGGELCAAARGEASYSLLGF